MDLSCALVKQRIQYAEGGASEKDVVSLTSGEPDTGLFDVSGYREGPPSTLTPDLWTIEEATCDPNCAAKQLRLKQSIDAHYMKHRRK